VASILLTRVKEISAGYPKSLPFRKRSSRPRITLVKSKVEKMKNADFRLAAANMKRKDALCFLNFENVGGSFWN
jgi:hypothetical protein